MFALIGDLHFGIKSGDRQFLDFQINYIKQFVDECLDSGITEIVQAGDFFDNRKSTDNYVMHKVVELFNYIKTAGITWHNIVGNHDIYHRNCNDVTPLDIMQGLFDNFKVYKTTQDVTIGGVNVCMIPWLDEYNMSKLEQSIASSKAKIAIGHLALDGFAMYKNSIAKHGLNKSLFKKFDKVYTGHYHTISINDNITYIGSPYHLNWADYADGDMRGWFIIDNDNAEFIQNTDDDSLFKVVEYDCYSEYNAEMLNHLCGKILNVIVNKKDTERHYKNYITLLNQVGVIDYRITDNTEIIVIKESAQQENEVTTVLDEFKHHIDDVSILELANTIYERVK